MSSIFIKPGKLKGVVIPPPSKSIAHRMLILSALAAQQAAGMTEIQNIDRHTSEDMAATIGCMENLFDADSPAEMDCGESGSTLRFLIPVAAAMGKTSLFRGQGRLPERPLHEYDSIFENKGVELTFLNPGRSLPLQISGQLTGGHFSVPGHISSQYISGLLLALPLLAEDSIVSLTSPLQSEPYVNLTEDAIHSFGARIIRRTNDGGQLQGWQVPGNQSYRMPPGGIRIEADYSQAAFWLVAKHLGQQISVTGLNPGSLQGDRVITSFLRRLKEAEKEQEIVFDMGNCPDLVPALAVAASARSGLTILGNASRLRIKESDRLAATSEGLNRLGAHIVAEEDRLLVYGGTLLKGGEADSHGDHRIAMALAIAALNSEGGVTIHGAQAVAKSYPGFFSELSRLGGDVHELRLG